MFNLNNNIMRIIKSLLTLFLILIFVYSPNKQITVVRNYSYIAGKYIYNFTFNILTKSENENVQKTAKFISETEKNIDE